MSGVTTTFHPGILLYWCSARVCPTASLPLCVSVSLDRSVLSALSIEDVREADDHYHRDQLQA